MLSLNNACHFAYVISDVCWETSITIVLSLMFYWVQGYLVPSFNLPQLNLAKCGKPQKVWTENLGLEFSMSKRILPYLFYSMTCGAQKNIGYVYVLEYLDVKEWIHFPSNPTKPIEMSDDHWLSNVRKPNIFHSSSKKKGLRHGGPLSPIFLI